MGEAQAHGPEEKGGVAPASHWALAVIIGCLMTLTVRGYQFGASNHGVYLLAAMRGEHPELLANDWWVNSTVQYHGVFTLLTRGLMQVHPEGVRVAFLVSYLLLVTGLHLAWARLALRLGGSWRAYLLSVTLYYLSAGGYGLGFYALLQDSSFLPSNVANVAMLAGIVAWVDGKRVMAGAALGIAGLFHLNHALVAPLLWGALSMTARRDLDRRWLVGSLLLLAGCSANVLPAVLTITERQGQWPLGEFVELYVRLRHPHHYDPSAWPVGLWVAFLWPVPLAVIAWKDARHGSPEGHCRAVFLFFACILLVALVGAGVWYVSETLIQLSLYRFSIFPKLLASIAAAILLTRRLEARKLGPSILVIAVAGVIGATVVSAGVRRMARENATALIWLGVLIVSMALPVERLRGKWRPRAALAGVLLVGTVILLVARGGDGLRLSTLPRDDGDYLALCRWASENTPADAVFLVPPDEESFRLHGRRAIVVNFKNVPQLSGELPEWRDRLQAVLGIDLRTLPRRFDETNAVIAKRYDALSPSHLIDVARRYDAQFVVTRSALTTAALDLVHSSGVYRLYTMKTNTETLETPAAVPAAEPSP